VAVAAHDNKIDALIGRMGEQRVGNVDVAKQDAFTCRLNGQGMMGEARIAGLLREAPTSPYVFI
jgi:hypothetical protein